MITEREASGGRREAVLSINSVEGIEKLGYAAIFCRAVLVPSNQDIAQQKFKTHVSKNGEWNQDFSFEYGTGNDELIFEVCEQKWFGREQLIGSATSSISDLLHKKHVSLSDCPGRVIVKLLDINMLPLPNTRRLSGKKRVKREMSSSGELDMATFFQKKIEVHKTMIESLGTAPDLLTASYDEDELKRALNTMEDSLRTLNNGNDSFKNILESLQPADYSKLEQEMSAWNSLTAMNQETAVQVQTDAAKNAQVSTDMAMLEVRHNSVINELTEKVQLLENELQIEKAQVAVLKKRNFDLEVEVKQKEEEIAGLRQKEDTREKMLWDNLQRIDVFDEKIQGMEVEREFMRECQKKLLAQEKMLQAREDQIQKSLQDMQHHRDMIDRVIKEQQTAQQAPKPVVVVDQPGWASPGGFLEEKLTFLTSRLTKLDQLDEVMRRLENMAAHGGSVSIKVDNSDHKRTASDIKAEMEELQKIICDENANAKDRESANLKIDRLFSELSKTEEYKAEVKRAAEEKIRINEPLNREALAAVMARFATMNPADLQARKRQCPALTLIGMDHHQILGKHQNDFNQYLLGDLPLEEVRAIRASMPIFRRDQKKQHDFVESLDSKIEQLAKNPPAVVKPKKVFNPNAAATTRPRAVGGGCGGGSGNMLAELMSKRRTTAE